jgi:hypothetical protein
MVDISIEDHGSVWLVRPWTTSAAAWLHDNVQHDALWFGRAVAVEPRYIQSLLVGLASDGFDID